MELREMNFGKSDGFKESSEPNFTELFYEKDGLYSELRVQDKYIILGRKGAGKTILASYYCQKSGENKEVSKQLFANDFIQKKLLNFAESEINKEENSLFWEYTFLLDIGNSILDYLAGLKFYSFKRVIFLARNKQQVVRLREIINNEFYKIQQITSDTFQQSELASSIGVNGKGGLDFSNKNLVSEKDSIVKRRSKYYETFPELKKLVLDLVEKLKVRVTIFYDDMDQFEESMELSSFKSLMKNMIYSADKLNKDLYHLHKSKICLVIREDIIDMLQPEANNLNKQIADCSIRIDWFLSVYDSPQMHPLMIMILHKIKNSGESFKDSTLNDIFQEIFEPGVFKFLLDRSFGRPRDIVRFLNFYKESFPRDSRITISNLQRVEQGYSKWFYDELLNEIAISNNKSDIKEILTYISKRGYGSFTYQKLFDYIVKDTGQQKEGLLEVLSVMRDYGIIGVINSQKKVDFTYRMGLSTRVNQTTKFILHNGLKKYLNI
ncbi:TPA: hypothetical protein U1C22_001259 [Streptococcus suis]|nr:hypothetical protein [Streptococcus suis]